MLNPNFFFFRFSSDFLFLGFQLLLELLYFFLVFDLNDLLNLDDLLADDAVLLHEFRGVNSRLEEGQLLFQFLNFILVLSKKSILRIFVNARPVLNVLSSGGVSEGVEGFIMVIVSRTHVSDHDSFCVSS